MVQAPAQFSYKKEWLNSFSKTSSFLSLKAAHKHVDEIDTCWQKP
jgi:hypothetical protein